jgi:hypothetical protein
MRNRPDKFNMSLSSLETRDLWAGGGFEHLRHWLDQVTEALGHGLESWTIWDNGGK